MSNNQYNNILPGGCVQTDLGLHRRLDGMLYFNAVNLSKDLPQEQLPNYNDWSCGQWINFHKKLKSLYGKRDANTVWSQFFDNKPAGWTKDKVCTANSYFTDYFSSQGITFDANVYTIVDDATGFLTSIPGNIKTALIVGGVVVGVTILTIIGVSIYRLVQVNGSMAQVRKKIYDNPEILLKAAML